MRPGVVWFGEQLDPRQIGRVESYLDSGQCDWVLVIGTTALFGYIVDWAMRAAGKGGRLIEINPEATSLSPFASPIDSRAGRRGVAQAGGRDCRPN